MAHFLSKVRMFSAYFANGIARAVQRRGYAAAAEAARGETRVSKAVNARSNGTVKMGSVLTKEEKTWMPDPKTGFYKPGNRRDEIDAAELRDLMLKMKDLHTTVPQ